MHILSQFCILALHGYLLEVTAILTSHYYSHSGIKFTINNLCNSNRLQTSFDFPLYKISAIRKLTEKRRKVEGNLERRDITKDYAGFNSETYAPMTRHGVFLDKGSEQYVVKSKYLSTYQGELVSH